MNKDWIKKAAEFAGLAESPPAIESEDTDVLNPKLKEQFEKADELVQSVREFTRQGGPQVAKPATNQPNALNAQVEPAKIRPAFVVTPSEAELAEAQQLISKALSSDPNVARFMKLFQKFGGNLENVMIALEVDDVKVDIANLLIKLQTLLQNAEQIRQQELDRINKEEKRKIGATQQVATKSALELQSFTEQCTNARAAYDAHIAKLQAERKAALQTETATLEQKRAIASAAEQEYKDQMSESEAREQRMTNAFEIQQVNLLGAVNAIRKVIEMQAK